MSENELNQPAQSSHTTPPAFWPGDNPIEIPPSAKETQPYPRSPKLVRSAAGSPKSAKHSKKELTRCLEELQKEQARTEAHLESLKKRSADLLTSAEAMKQKISEQYEGIRAALQRDERAVLDTVEQERRETGARLSQVQKDWKQHLSQVQKEAASVQAALEQSEGGRPQENTWDPSRHRKKQANEEGIRMNEERFQKLLKILRNILKDLQAQLQRKNFVLDSWALEINRESCHRQIIVSRSGRGMCLSGEAQPVPELPARFDRVCCALGSVGVAAGRRYWEVDVRCCPAWALGAAYGQLERKGLEKSAKLGRNRHSWCVELREGRLSAWHNDRHMACPTVGPELPQRVGVAVDYERGRLAFYDAGTMKLLQEFSATLMPVFDRMHHHFTEPVFPAFRFFKPDAGQHGPNHMEICHFGF